MNKNTRGGTMARPIKFLHAADLHLGASFIGAQLRDEKLGAKLRQSVYKAYENVIDIAVNEQVDFVCFAGDLFNSAESDYRAQGFFIEGLQRLADADIPAYIVAGNHDPLDGSDRLTLPANTICFGTDKTEIQLFKKEGVQTCAIYGRSYPCAQVDNNYAPGYRRCDEADNAIGILHTNIGTVSAGERYARCELSDLADTGIDYWALGHIHLAQVLNEVNPCVIYAGSPQALNINEIGKHGCYVVQLDRGTASYEWHNTNLIEMKQLPVDITSASSINEVRELIAQDVVEKCPAQTETSYLVRIALAGTSHLDTQLNEEVLSKIYDSTNIYLNGPAPHVHLDSRIVNATVSDVSKEMQATTNEFLRSILDTPAEEFLDAFDVVNALKSRSDQLPSAYPEENDALITEFSNKQKLESLYEEAQELLFRLLTEGGK